MDRSHMISRLLRIITYLKAHPGSKVNKLAGEFMVSERTIFRDLLSLGEANIPIVCHREDGYKIDPDFFLHPIRFDFGEICALFLAGLRLGLRRETMFHEEYLHALDKIKANMDSQTRETLDRMEETTYLNIPKNNKVKDIMLTEDFSRLNEAIQKKKTLLISYFNPAINKPETRMVDPYGILYAILSSVGWWVLGFCHKTRQIRIFKIEHIKKMRLLHNSKFELPRNFSVPKYTRDVIEKAEDLFNKGFTFTEKDEDEKAIPFYKEAILLNPAYGYAYFQLGVSYRMTFRNEMAIEEFKKAIKYESNDPSLVYYNLAQCLYEMGKKKEAIAECKKAIKTEPKFSSLPHVLLAEIYSDMQKYDEAIKEYEKAIKFDPEDEEPYQKLISLYKKTGKMDEADRYQEMLNDLAENGV